MYDEFLKRVNAAADPDCLHNAKISFMLVALFLYHFFQGLRLNLALLDHLLLLYHIRIIGEVIL